MRLWQTGIVWPNVNWRVEFTGMVLGRLWGSGKLKARPELTAGRSMFEGPGNLRPAKTPGTPGAAGWREGCGRTDLARRPAACCRRDQSGRGTRRTTLCYVTRPVPDTGVLR